MTPDVAVLGAGLIGRLLAVALTREGYRVRLYEQGGPDGGLSAAHVAAAMLAPLAESVVSEPLVVALGLASLKRWPDVLSRLSEPVFFQQNGTLIVWHSQDRDQAAMFSSRLRQMDAGLGPDDRPRELSGVELAALEPALERRFPRGLFLPHEGQLDNRALLSALLTELDRAGVHCHWQTPMAPGAVNADWVIDCRGLGARPDWLAVRGVRGEVLRVHAPEVRLTRPLRLLHPRYPIYIAPKPDGVYVVGATQIESEDLSPTSVRSALELLSALYSVHPAFGEARILELATQCRPALPDNLPEIRWDGGRLIQINGLYRHGYLIAPALLDAGLALIRRLSAGGTLSTDWRDSQPWPSIYHYNDAA
ncbi:MAG: FAD-dependent oxidoreductase [Methylococcaceae bacterium]